MVGWETSALGFGIWMNADSFLLTDGLVFVCIWERRGLFFVLSSWNREVSFGTAS